MKPSPESRSALVAALAVLGALAIAVWPAERSTRWQEVGRTVRARTVPGSALGSAGLSRSLRSLRLLHALPRARRSNPPAARLGAIPARRGSTPDQLSLDPLDERQLLSAYRLGRVGPPGEAPLLALLLPGDDMREIRNDPLLRGRASEHAGYLGWFEDGRLVLGTGVGVRLHGGRSRLKPGRRSYRLVFRRRYGEPAFVPVPFAARRDHPPRRLVVRSDSGPDRHGHVWHFSNPLALDIARRIGVPAPRSRPVHFVLNGRSRGVFSLTEYLGPGFLEAYFGHQDFTLVRTKQNTFEDSSMVKLGDPEPYGRFLQQVGELRHRDSDSTLEDVARSVDLDNLYRWVVAVTFLDTRDVYQGPLVRDLADASARWFWIAWDLDISFGLPEHGWLRNSLMRTLLGTRERNDPRKRLLLALLWRPEQRRRLAAVAVDALNHRIDPGFLNERLAYYRAQAELFGITDQTFLNEIEEFLRERPAVYLRHLQDDLQLGRLHRVRMSGPAGSVLDVDGHPTSPPWEGKYFEGMTVSLSVPPEERTRVAGLRIDGVPASARHEVEITVLSDHSIELQATSDR